MEQAQKNLPSHCFCHASTLLTAFLLQFHAASLFGAEMQGCARHSLQPQIWPATKDPTVTQVSAYMHVQVSCLDCTLTSRADLPKVFSKALRTSDMMRERLAKAKLAAAAMAAK